MKELWRKEFTGENRAGLMVNSVKLKLDKVTMTPEELTLDKIRRIPEARICAAIGLRPTVLGLTVGEEQRTYNNGKEDRRAAYDDCLRPLQRQLGKQASRQCPELCKRNERLGWDYSAVPACQEDATDKAKRATILVAGQLATRNEGRSIVGLPRDEKQGDEYVTTLKIPQGADTEIGGNKV
jgi:hypothetical protein